MKKLLLLIFTCITIHVLNAQPATVTEYIYVGQPSFSYNRGATEDFSFGKGSYEQGTVTYSCLTRQPVSGSTTVTNCGNGTGQYKSKTNNISPGASDGIEIAYPFTKYTPYYSNGAKQLMTSLSTCTGTTGTYSTSFSGSCSQDVNSKSVDFGTDIKTITLDFKSKVSIVNVCSTDEPVNLKSTDYWTYISVPKDYGSMTFTAEGASSAISGNFFDPDGLEGQFTITAYLPFFKGTAEATLIINVVENEKPNAGADQAICKGTSINLFSNTSTTTGTWSGTGVQSDKKTFNSTSLAPGNYTVKLTKTNGICEAYDTKVITVKSAPAQTSIADISICQNAPAYDLFYRNVTDGSSNWYIFDQAQNDYVISNAIDYENNVLYPNLLDDGSYTLLYREINDDTGCKMEDVVNLTIKEIPVFSMGTDVNLCINQGSYNILDDIPQATIDLGGTFTYSGNFMTAGTYNFMPNIAGEGQHNIFYEYTNLNHCTVKNAKTITVVSSLTVINNNPDVYFMTSSDTITVGEKVIFTSLTEGNEFLWEFSNGSYSIQKDPGVFFQTPGIFDVVYTLKKQDNCAIQVNSNKRIVVLENFEKKSITDICENLEIEDPKSRTMKIIPNPFTDLIKIDLTEFSSEDLETFGTMDVKIVNLMGETKFTNQYSLLLDVPYIDIDLSTFNFESGLYIINIKYGHSSVNYRLIKK